MPKRGRRRQKSRTHPAAADAADPTAAAASTTSVADHNSQKIPKSLVVRRGACAPEVVQLVKDLRHVMLPYTALHFEERGKTTIQQYVTSLALPMGITHLLQLSQKDDHVNMRLARLPEGPTLSLRVHRFSLCRHVVQLQKRPVAQNQLMMLQSPVVVTNNFGDHTAAPHIKLMRITFQNLFAQINVSSVKLADCRRVVLFNLVHDESSNSDNDEAEVGPGGGRDVVHVRHYAVKATPVGVHRRVRKLVQANQPLPNLHSCRDIADYLTQQSYVSDAGSAASDSEAEDGSTTNVVELPDRYAGPGNRARQRSALKLIELGPRLELQLIKVVQGLDSGGPCLYHAHVTKTPPQVAELQRRKEHEVELKRQRQAVQNANVERKRAAAQLQKEQRHERQNAKKQRPDDAPPHATARGGGRDATKIDGVSSSSENENESSSDEE